MGFTHFVRAAAAVAATSALALSGVAAHGASLEGSTNYEELLAAVAANSSTQSSKILPVRPMVQQGEYWCWVATGLGVTQYLGQGSSASQRDFCNAGRGNAAGSYCPDQPAEMYNVLRAARSYGVNSGNATRTISFSEIQRNIDSNSPMPAGYYWKAGGGHMVTITGYDANTEEITINDSLPQNQRQARGRYSDFVNNNSWRWAETITGMGGSNSSWPKADAGVVPVVEVAPASVAASTMQADAAVSRSAAQAVAAHDVAGSVAKLLVGSSADGASVQDVTSQVQVSNDVVAVNTLNPEFVAGRSGDPAVASGFASRATAGERSATVMFADRNGTLDYSMVMTGDDEVRYAAQANGGVVFNEPQIAAWYRIADGQVTALNDSAREVVGEGKSLAEYQSIVTAKYGDKLEGSAYQNSGLYGGF